jgi:hypothetical protein
MLHSTISIPPVPPLKSSASGSSSSSSASSKPAQRTATSTTADESSSSSMSSSSAHNGENRSLNNVSTHSASSSTSFNGSRILSTTLDDSNGSTSELQIASQLPDVTVRAYLESVCETLSNRIVEHARSQIKTLMDEFEAEKKLLLEDAEGEREKRQRRDVGRTVRIEIANKKEALAILKSSTFASTFPTGEIPEFSFELVPKKVVKLGRSRGAAFQPPRGISLCWDDEVSTTHGHFVLSADGLSVCFVDVGSTNGSKLDKGGLAWEASQKPSSSSATATSTTPGGSARIKAVSLEPNVAVVIEEGDVLYCGAMKLRVKCVE